MCLINSSLIARVKAAVRCEQEDHSSLRGLLLAASGYGLVESQEYDLLSDV